MLNVELTGLINQSNTLFSLQTFWREKAQLELNIVENNINNGFSGPSEFQSTI